MPADEDRTLPLHSDTFYYIYNRENNGNPIFFQEKNYKYFLEKYAEYISDYMDTYAYCLIPNHFHLLIKIKPEKEVLDAASRDLERVSKSFWNMLFEEIRKHPKGYFSTGRQDFPNFENLENLRNFETEVNFKDVLSQLPK